MKSPFNSVSNDNRQVSIEALRGHALKRLDALQQTLAAKGIAAPTSSDAGDMGLIGTLLMGMLVGGPFAEMLQNHFPMLESFNMAAAPAALDGLAMLEDERSEGYRKRVANAYYPEGRRRAALFAAPAARRFNLAATNQNHLFSFDTKAEIACMCEILDLLDMLEEQGVKTIGMDERVSVYETLVQLSADFTGKTAARSHKSPVRLAVA